MAKPRPRKLKAIDPRLTAFLDIDELKAIGGDEYNIEAMSPNTEVPPCIECGGPTENHGKFDKVLIDIVSVDGQKHFARLHYRFYKYRCLNKVPGHENCNVLFQKPVGFISSENAKITRRYEDEVMRHAMYESLAEIRSDMTAYIVKERRKDLISRPAMSKLIKRWVAERDGRRSFVPPAALLLYTYQSFYNYYVVIADAEPGIPCRIIEVLPAVTEAAVRGFFARIDTGGLRAVVVDCNPVLYDTVKAIIPRNKVMVDTNSLKRVLRDEFKIFVYERLKRYPKYVREVFLAGPDAQASISSEDSATMKRLLQNDAELANAYAAYADLYALLQKHRDISELIQRKEMLDEANRDTFLLTISYMEAYKEELARYHQGTHSGEGDRIYDEIYDLNRKIETYFPVSTDEVFRARILYSDFSRPAGRKWQGIDVSRLRDIIDNMIITGDLKEHER